MLVCIVIDWYLYKTNTESQQDCLHHIYKVSKATIWFDAVNLFQNGEYLSRYGTVLILFAITEKIIT